MLILNQKEVEKIIPLREIKKIINVVERGFFDYGQGKTQMPPKLYLDFKEFKGDLRIMSSYSKVLKMAGTKIVSVHPENPKKGFKTVMAVIILNDPRTGLPLVLMDGTYITALRTGAAGAIATKYLARKNSQTLGVIGAGIQAVTQIAAITKVRRIKEIFVFDIVEKNIANLAKILRKEEIKIKKAHSLEKASRVDILTTTTPSREPTIKREWILPGTHINAIGADAPGKEELDPQIIKEGKVVVDCWEQASCSGEINVPFSEGMITEKGVYAQLDEIVSGKKPGRTNEKEITIFDSTGLAIQDLYTADLIYKLAKNKKYEINLG